MFRLEWETEEGNRLQKHSMPFSSEEAMKKAGKTLEEQGILPVYVRPM